MELANIPYKFQYQWAQNATSGYVTDPIPVTTAAPAASQSLGFPPQTAEPIAAGGTPPSIEDVNGAYQYITSWLQWLQAGYPILYDATFQTNIGGYPKNAMICSVAYPGVIWQSAVDNNTSDPDTGGANWVSLPVHGELSYFSPGTYTFVVPIGITRIKIRVWGAGGGGGSAIVVSSAGSGAGPGGYEEGWYSVTPGQSITVIVGSGGIGSTGAFNGTAGGDSSVGSFLSATGGGGGYYSGGGGQTMVGLPGTGTGGQVSLSGQSGGQGLTPTSSLLFGGFGGAPPFGSLTPISIGGAGSPGLTPGGAGAGGSYSGVGGEAGGNGGDGGVIIEW